MPPTKMDAMILNEEGSRHPRQVPDETRAAAKMLGEPLPGDQADTGQFAEFAIKSRQFVARAGAFRQDHAVGEGGMRRQIILER